MSTTSELYGICPFVTAQKVLSGKWSIVILSHLNGKTMRFNELHKQMQDLTQATLTKQLRFLEDEGLIERKVYAQVPPKVEYSLTPIGKKFHTVLNSLEQWGHEYISFLHKKSTLPQHGNADI